MCGAARMLIYCNQRVERPPVIAATPFSLVSACLRNCSNLKKKKKIKNDHEVCTNTRLAQLEGFIFLCFSFFFFFALVHKKKIKICISSAAQDSRFTGADKNDDLERVCLRLGGR